MWRHRGEAVFGERSAVAWAYTGTLHLLMTVLPGPCVLQMADADYTRSMDAPQL